MRLLRNDLTVIDYYALLVGSVLGSIIIISFLLGHLNATEITLAGFALGLIFSYSLIHTERIDQYKKEIAELKAQLYDKRVDKNE